MKRVGWLESLEKRRRSPREEMVRGALESGSVLVLGRVRDLRVPPGGPVEVLFHTQAPFKEHRCQLGRLRVSVLRRLERPLRPLSRAMGVCLSPSAVARRVLRLPRLVQVQLPGREHSSRSRRLASRRGTRAPRSRKRSPRARSGK